MHFRLRFIPIALLAALAATSALAEPIDRYWTVTPFGGFTIFDAKMLFPGTKPLTDNVYFGGRLGYQAKKWMGIEVASGFTRTEEDVLSSAREVDWFHTNGDLIFTPWASRFGGPFLLAGGGAGQIKPSAGDPKIYQGTADYGGGLLFWLTDNMGLRFEARQLLWIPKETSEQKFTTTVIGGGLTFALGASPRDTDGDRVPDSKDKCPDTPKGARVDALGCPHDADGDGVLDGLDSCPATPKGATVGVFGCPSDADKDLVFDGLDQCPDTPQGARVDEKGCPMDSDGDGVLDGLDLCPNTPKGARIDASGCTSDSDNDGVLDGIDKCPDTPAGAKVDQDGCPMELIEKETELLDTGMIRLQDVNFETGKAALLPESSAPLDQVGQILTKWPDLKVEIRGHTDATGSDSLNMMLSQTRAGSVLAYMQTKFTTLTAGQFTAKGYGESRPIAPNNTALGRAKNRRVEFVVLNKDVLKKETERRRLLQKSETPAVPNK